MILLAARMKHVPVYEYTPMQVKQSVVGYGKAVKAQVMEMTRSILGLEKIPKPDDAADALALAVCHAHAAGSIPLQLTAERAAGTAVIHLRRAKGRFCMIYSVHGKLIHTESGFAVVECAGVGYKCLTTLSTLSRLPRLGREATLYTHLNVREDAVDLFGFYDQGN